MKRKSVSTDAVPPPWSMDGAVERAAFELLAWDRTFWSITTFEGDSKNKDMGGTRRLTKRVADASLICSRRWDGTHALTLDLDVPARLYPSSTPEHSHLYIDVGMPWWKYRVLMRVLAWCGILEKNYYKASVRKGGSFLRVPWVKK